MSFIAEIGEAEASGPAAAYYAAAKTQHGQIYNLHRACGRLPELAEHFEAMTAALKERMGLRRYELVTLAAALALRSSYCALAHGKVLLDNGMTAEELERIATERGHTSITPQEADLMGYAADIVEDATAIGPARIAGLRAHGLSDDEIAQAAAAASLRCYFSKYLDALGTRPDPAFMKLPEALRTALARGRAIEEPED
ncbi:MAG: carboxymuconolactone decarboxylase family protein [Limimaricola soesokkakensis]|uniref:carboxymuconolactone decarboxylase family protein n=1 Tax=Limimaricola soesokkakensis TaxID=1343159 RepID=UPI004057FED5